MNIDQLIQEAHETAVSKGWWQDKDRNFGEQVALMHAELSEALEEYRKFGLHDEAMLYTDLQYEHQVGEEPTHNFVFEQGDKPEGIAAEFADVLVRIFDTCGRYGIPLAKALEVKMAYNKSRPYRHGNKKA